MSDASTPVATTAPTTTPLDDWVSRLADEVIAAVDAASPGKKIICASGLSPSGPIHLGNLREVMTPHLVADEIRRRGRECEHIISWDDYDRFRKVPGGIAGIETWSEHIGKPLTAVPAPPGSSYPNWAEHFKAAQITALAELGVIYRGVSQTEQYTSGVYVEQVLTAMAKRDVIDAVLDQYRTKDKATGQPKAKGGQQKLSEEEAAAAAEAAEGSGAAGEDDGSTSGAYFPFKPFSKATGTDLTTVTAYDPATHELTYVTETGVTETMNLTRDFHGKLVWKVDWPMRWAFEGVDFEPSGVDHSSPGSSFQVGGQIVGPVFGGHQPVGPMYAFVGIAGMAKMSSSRGGVPTPGDALQIMEPQLLRWLYARRRPNQSFTIAFDAELLRIYDEWDALQRKIASGKGQPGDIAAFERAAGTASGRLPVTPLELPYRALVSVIDLTGGNEEQMLRILQGMDSSGALTSLDQLRPRLTMAQTWVATRMQDEDRTVVLAAPNTDRLAALSEEMKATLALLAGHLEDDWTLDGLTTLVYGVPKLRAGLDIHEKKLPPEVKAAQKELFAELYQLLVGADTGPRLPTLLLCIGAERTRMLIGH